jgi:hypothetical protein
MGIRRPSIVSLVTPMRGGVSTSLALIQGWWLRCTKSPGRRVVRAIYQPSTLTIK